MSISEFQIFLMVLILLLGVFIGLIIGEILTPNINKKRKLITNGDNLLNKIYSINNILRSIEKNIGIDGENLVSQSLKEQLFNLESRLQKILEKISPPETKLPQITRWTDKEKQKLQSMLDEKQMGRKEYSQTEEPVQKQYVVPPNENRQKPSAQLLTKEQKLTYLYNEAIDKRELRDALWQEFEVIQIENINAVEQRLGNTGEPEFKQSDSGNFYAIINPRERIFWVIPKFDFTVKQSNYENTVKFVFHCENYNDNESYSRIHLIQPAIFTKNSEKWQLHARGRLLLRQ